MTAFTHLRLLAAAGAALCAGVASAQSNVTISGSIDMGVFRDTAGVKNVGTIQRSHLQFAGTEDLGGGLAATFRLRHRFDADTGTPEGGTSKPFWHGESTVGIKGGFGALRLGRALDAIQDQDWAFDAWSNYDRIVSPAWDLWHWNYSADPVGGGSGRIANAVFYDSPKFSNVSLHVSASPESPAGAVAKTRAATLLYNDGKLRMMLGSGKNSAGATETSVGVRAAFGMLSLMGMVNVSETLAGSKAKVATLGAVYVMGATTLKAGWGKADVDGVKRREMVSASAGYSLSKRTTVYADLASKRILGTGTKEVYGVGLTHSF
ncbi:porin [Roseateles sp.]|uniref:porin n=1 Tax=Roseateles sp. TaxID=1971397 RepID=UPI003264B838